MRRSAEWIYEAMYYGFPLSLFAYIAALYNEMKAERIKVKLHKPWL